MPFATLGLGSKLTQALIEKGYVEPTPIQTKAIPVIVLTACGWRSERDRARAAGCDVFLAKPCLPDLLVREIRRLLRLYGAPKPQPSRALQATPRKRLAS